MSKKLLLVRNSSPDKQIWSIEFGVFQNLKEQPWSKGLSSMHRNYSAPTVIMPNEMMASFNADNLKSMHDENLDELFTFEFR